MHQSLNLRWDWTAFFLFALVLASVILIKNIKPIYLALRVAALTIILWLILEPSLTFMNEPSGKASLSVLVDVSRSMSIEDTQERLFVVKETLKKIRQDLEKNFDVSYYEFSEQCSKTDLKDLRRAHARGERTNIHGALDHIARENKLFKPNVLLFSDGIENTTESAWAYDNPVFAVLFGQKGALRDIALTELRGSDFAFKNRPVEFKVVVQNSGFKGRKASLLLKEKKGQSWAESQIKEIAFPDSTGEQEVTFKIV